MSLSQFCWYDLMTTDVDRAKAFYTELFGWKIQPMEMPSLGVYNMLSIGDNSFGGIAAVDANHGMPSHWIGYISVEDVDGAAGKVDGLGGKVMVPPTDIPQTGRFCVVQDANGAYVNLFEGLKSIDEPITPVNHGVCWNELITADFDKAKTFYDGLVGWKNTTPSFDSSGNYVVFNSGEHMAAGLMKPQAEHPPTWMSYFLVEDIKGYTERVKTLGGNVLMAGIEIPIGKISVVMDPTGATFGLFEEAASTAG